MAIQLVSVFGTLDQAIIDAINQVSMPAFAQVWGVQGELTLERPPGAWAMWMLREADVPGDLAYHIYRSGVPIAQIFTDTIERSGDSICQCVDHELKEMLADPTAGSVIPWPGGNIVKEVCDPVSGDGLDLGNGLTGANFVYPSWFNNGPGPWDARGLCTRPGEIRPGGYVEQDVNGQWLLTAMRGDDGMPSWRISQKGRLALRASGR